MNSSGILELAIIAFIVIGIGAAIWRGGARNPVGTGALQKDVSKLKSEVGAISGSVERLNAHFVTAQDFEREQVRIEKALAALGSVESELAMLASNIGARNAVTEALAESVRAMAAELKAHQKDVSARFEQLSDLSERIEANRAGIDSIIERLPAITLRQSQMAEEVSSIKSGMAGVAAATQHTGKQVDRLYDVLVTKGMEK